jgi:hypothetical protein
LATASQKKVDPELYPLYREFHVIFCRLFEAVSDNKELSKSDTENINTVLKTYLPEPKLYWDKKTLKYNIEFQEDPEPRSHILMEIFYALSEEDAEKSKLFARCEECKNPFLIQRDGQRYCSQRCRTRITSRRRYATLFSEYESTRRKPTTGKNAVKSQQ